MATDGYYDDQTRSFTTLAAGTIFSHYKIISKIGAGGMGEVYLAEDTQLDRKIALKFLPPHLTQDEAARARFTREAKAAARLDHPNIVQVFEVGEFHGRPFFAMAHIEGKSLRTVIKEGKLSINEAIELTKQICEGLNKAHESGVVHRDIKPGNIIIDEDNKARILDFGLATVAGKDKLTKTGSTLGTVGYMSPEQIEGKKVDHRSDLFSVGVILFEMLTGRRPFEGDTDAAVARSITDTTPEPIARYKSGTTGELQQVVDKALSKDPSLRYQHADGMLADLKRIEVGTPIAHKRRLRRVATLVLLGIAIASAIGYYTIKFDTKQPTIPVRKRQVTFDGDVHSCAISPDAKFIAYVRGMHAGTSKPLTADSMHLYVLDLDGGEPLKIFTDWWITGVWWSPDGRELLVRGDNDEQGGFYKLPRLGGSARFYSIKGVGTYWCISWSPDGHRFAAASDYWPKSYFVVDVSTGENIQIDLEGDFDWIWYISWSPTSDELLLITSSGDGFRSCITPIQGGELKVVGHGMIGSPVWSRDDRSITYISSGGDLKNIGFDEQANVFEEESKLLVADVTNPYLRVSYDSRAGTLCFVSQFSWSNLGIAELDQNGKVTSKVQPLTTGTASYSKPSLSPNGKEVVCTKTTGGIPQVVVINTETGQSRQISHTGDYNIGGAWSPDGDRLAYATIKGGIAKLAIVDVKTDVSKAYDSCIVNQFHYFHHSVSWAPGNMILYETPGGKSLMSFDPDLETSISIGPPNDGQGFQFAPIGSPKGEIFSFLWNRKNSGPQFDDSLQSGVWLSTYQGENAKLILPSAYPIGWSDDGEWIYAWRGDIRTLCRVSTITGAVDSLGTVPNAPRLGVTISSDATKLVYVHEESTSDVWLLENIPLP